MPDVDCVVSGLPKSWDNWRGDIRNRTEVPTQGEWANCGNQAVQEDRRGQEGGLQGVLWPNFTSYCSQNVLKMLNAIYIPRCYEQHGGHDRQELDQRAMST